MLDMTSFRMMNTIAEKVGAKKYLEIGVCKGETFVDVAIDLKVAVDPNFQFDIKKYENEKTKFFITKSDEFFENFKQEQKNPPFNAKENNFTFDIIFIDGYHSFEQSYKDFENSLAFAHDKTIWVIDDTIPWDPFSAYTDEKLSLKYRNLYGFADRPWHGDVFKTIFAIHEFHPEFSYSTHFDGANAQTLLWKTDNPAQRQRLFSDELNATESIKKLTFFDLLEKLTVLNPRTLDSIYPLFGTTLDDKDFCTIDAKQAIHPLEQPLEMRFGNFKRGFMEEFSELKTEIAKLTTTLSDLTTEISTYKEENANLKNALVSVKQDISETKENIITIIRRHIKKSRKIFLTELAVSTLFLLLVLLFLR